MNVIYSILYGSHCYGTNTPTSDVDIRGIYLPSLYDCLSLDELEDFSSMVEGEDILIYPIQKFFKLAMNANPSVLEWLFVPESCVRKNSEIAQIIIKNRDLFLSKEIYHRFRGFATSEFHSLRKLTGKTGDKRKKEILKIGYSPKNATNVIRLMEQGIELLETSNLTFPRPNKEFLLEVKLGKLKYDDISRKFSELETKLDEALKKTELPDKPDKEKINNLLVDILKKFAI